MDEPEGALSVAVISKQLKFLLLFLQQRAASSHIHPNKRELCSG